MTAPETGMSRELTSLLDRQEIADRISDLALGLDLRDFHRYRRCFADEVEIRNPRFSGPAGVRSRTGDDWASSVYQTQSQLDYSLHTLTTPGIDLRGDEADVAVIQQASFGLGADSYRVGGPLRLRFTRTPGGWRVSRLDFNATWAEGDSSVYERAREAAAGAAAVTP